MSDTQEVTVSLEDRVLNAISGTESVPARAIADQLGVSIDKVRVALKKQISAGKVAQEGQKRGTKYRLVQTQTQA